jgi:hypothetical protein
MSCYLRLSPAVVAAALLSGCGPELSNNQPLETPVAARAAAQDISGVDGSGATIKLSDYRGKVVLVDFWRDT